MLKTFLATVGAIVVVGGVAWAWAPLGVIAAGVYLLLVAAEVDES